MKSKVPILVYSHILKTPPFTDEVVSNYISYGRNVFSCDVAFKKNMYLTKTEEDVVDETNSTFYFIKYEGHWVIVELCDVLNK